MKTKLLIVLFLFVYYHGYSQIKNLGIPYIKNFTQDDYDGGTQNWAIFQDSRGLIYIANNSGIIEYDGNTWQKKQVTNKTTIRCFSVDSNGKIYIGAQDEFGYLESDSIGRTQYHSLMHLIPEKFQRFKDVWKIWNFNNKIVLVAVSKIFIIDGTNLKVIESEKGFHQSFLVQGKLYVREIGKGLGYIDNDKFVLLPDGEKFANERIYSLLPWDDGKLLIGVRNIGFYLYDGVVFTPWHTEIDEFVKKNQLYCGIYISENLLAFGTAINGLAIIDKKGKIVQFINKEKGLQDNAIYSMLIDKQGNLWVALGSGVSYIEINSPFSFFNDKYGLAAKMYASAIYHDKLYIGGEPAIFYRKWVDYENPFTTTNFTKIEKTNGQNWLLKNVDNQLLICHNPHLFILNQDNITELKINDQNIWTIFELKDYKNTYFCGTNEGIYVLQKEGNNFKIRNKIGGFRESTRFVEIDNEQNVWVSLTNKGIYKIRFQENLDSVISVKLYNSKNGLPSDFGNRLFLVNNKLIAASATKFYSYNPNTDKFIPYEPFNKYLTKDKGVSILGREKSGNVWYSDDNGLGVFVLKEDKTYLSFRTPFYKLFKMGETYHVNTINYTSVIIGTNKGFIHYDPTYRKDYATQFNTLIRKVENIANDTVIFGGNYPENSDVFGLKQSPKQVKRFDSQTNSFRFVFAAAFYENTDKTEFQYKLEGFDKEWSNWTKEYKKEYTNLPEGNYTFKVRARNVFQTIGNEATYTFSIAPPWYKTIFAYIAYLILFVLLFYFGITFYTRRLKQANIKLERIVQERTSEIRKQNEEILKQKEEIVQQAHKLELANVELEKLSIVASETDNAVLIFDNRFNLEWVNTGFTKLYEYSLDEFRRNKSTNIIESSSNADIKKIIKQCIETQSSISYEAQNKTKSGKTIWVQTTLNPIIDKDGSIKKIIAVESDITKMKEAEEEIFQQNIQIKASIRYALTIQRAILPIKEEIDKVFDNFIIYRPKDIVSGDFYWFSTIEKEFSPNEQNKLKISIDSEIADNNQFKANEILSLSNLIFVAAVDCTGHGVPGAFMSMVGNRLLNEIVNEKRNFEPALILDQLNFGISKALRQKSSDNNDGMDICLCKIEKVNELNKITFSGAKLPIFYHKKNTDEIIRVKGDNKRIGGARIRRKESVFTNKELFLQKDDLLVLATDGMIDQNNQDRKRFGTQNFMNILLECKEQPLDNIKENLEKALDSYQADQMQRDDITVIGIKF